MRILRDGMILSVIGPEGTSIAKIISLVLVLFFVGLQRILLKKFSMNAIIRWFSIMFGLIIGFVYFDLIPNNHLQFNLLPPVVNKLINNSEILIFYILSELFAVFIVTNFWLLCNVLLKNVKNNQFIYNQLFSLSQVGVLFASMLCILFRKFVLIFVCVGVVAIVCILFFIPLTRSKKSETNQDGVRFSKKIILIPLITVLCGMVAGILDPYTKFQIQKISINSGALINRLSTIWFLQAALAMIFSEVLKRRFFLKKLLTPIFLITALSFLLISKNFISQFAFTLFCSAAIIGFKTLKYSAHSPDKESYIRTRDEMHSILIFEGFAGRFGKNSVAILLSVIFSFGYRWSNIENYMLVLAISCSVGWLVLSIKRKDEKIPK